MHLHGGDTKGGGVEEEVQGPQGGTKCVTDAGHSDGADGAHLSQDVGQAGLEGDLDLLGPVGELRVSLVHVHEVVLGDGGGCHSDDYTS